MSVLASLKVVLGLDTGPFQTSARRAQAEAKSMAATMQSAGRTMVAAGVAIAGTAIAQQFISMTKAGLEFASSLGETAQQLGVSAKSLQEYRYAATQAGVSSDEMDQALGQLTKRIGAAVEGSKAQVEAFKKLGISVKDANGQVLDAGEAIPKIAEALRNVQSPAERAAILVDLFGKAGQKLEPLMADGAKGVNNLRDAAHRLGIVLSEEQIARADKAADTFAELKTVLDAKISMSVADNADSILALAESLMSLVDAAGSAARAWQNWRKEVANRQDQNIIDGWFTSDAEKATARDRINARNSTARVIMSGGGGYTPKPGTSRPTSGFAAPLVLDPNKVNPWSGASYGTPSAISQRRNFAAGGGMFDFAPGLSPLFDLEAMGRVRAAFSDMRRDLTSPDLVDGIAAQMARLDGAMVKPADKATKETAEAFRKLAAEVQPLLDRLFPEARALNDWRGDLATLDRAEKGGLLSGAQAAEARKRLNREAISGTLETGAGAFGDLVSGAFDKVKGSFAGVTDDMDQVREKLIEANRNIGKSFTDMAQEAVRAIGTLGHAIKDGDFFDILDAVVGLGIQLGSMGLFGQGAAKAINGARIPGYAGGTRWHPGGLAMVGERGPELLSLPRGVQVTPNNKLGWSGGGTTIHQNFTGNLMTQEFWDRIQAGDSAAAQAGAQGGATLLMHRQSRSLGR